MNAQMLPEHLLEQARHLAQRERNRPRQASLRRAVSTAYYALFHFLIREATRQFGPDLSEENYNRVYRWFDHGTMARVARAFSEKVVRIPNSKELLLQNNPSWIQLIAFTFAELQEWRHSADYDPGAQFVRAEVVETIRITEHVIRQWKTVKNSPEVNAFLLSLLLWEKWGKQR
jgi:uncharacterized protein (UPF0332 family)